MIYIILYIIYPFMGELIYIYIYIHLRVLCLLYLSAEKTDAQFTIVNHNDIENRYTLNIM